MTIKLLSTDSILVKRVSSGISGTGPASASVNFYVGNTCIASTGTSSSGAWKSDLMFFESFIPVGSPFQLKVVYIKDNKILSTESTPLITYLKSAPTPTPAPAPAPAPPVSPPVPAAPAAAFREKTFTNAQLDSTNAWGSAPALPLFANGISFRDIRQGAVGDCQMMSSLATYAYSRPDLIERNIWLDSNGMANVRMDRKDAKVIYKVDTALSTVYARNTTDNWVGLYEKGNLAAAIDGTYSISGGPARKGYDILQTCSSVQCNMDSTTPLNSTVAAAGERVSQGYSGILGYDFHAYAALDYDVQSKKWYLYNPYGSSTDYVPASAANSGFQFTGRSESYVQTMGNGQKLTTTSGADVITGSTSNDCINALAGDDILNGKGGIDWLTGGSGRDSFDLRDYTKAGSNDYAVVQDFWSVKDSIILSKGTQYTLKPTATFDGMVSRDLFTVGGDLVAHIQGIESDLNSLNLSMPLFSFL